ncbi:pyrroloquinoline quinone precursor peptide PqqA [Streptomyces sp. SYSU K217416]
MNQTMEQTELVQQTSGEEGDDTTWQTPGHLVVETALEVTAYSLNSR